MKSIQSPCKNCPWHKAGIDKNSDICRKCQSDGVPLQYVKELGGLSESLPIDISLDNGNGGIEIPNPSTQVESEIENLITKICNRHHIKRSNLKRGFQGLHYNRARVDIVFYFQENESGLNQRQIGEMIGCSSSRVSQIMKEI